MRQSVLLAVLVLGSGCESRTVSVNGDAVAPSPADGRAAPDARSSDGPDNPRADSATSGQRFAVHFFTRTGGTVYDYPSLEAATSDLVVGDAAGSITERDIEQCQVDPAPSSRVLLRLTAAASAQQGALLRSLRDNQPFFVTFDHSRLYVGVVYLMQGAAAITTPVLHIDDQGGRIELKIGSHQGAWVGWGSALGGSGPPIDPAQLRARFEELGKLSAL